MPKSFIAIRLTTSAVLIWDHRSLPVQSLSIKSSSIKFLPPHPDHPVLPQQNPKPSSQSLKNNVFVDAARDSNHQLVLLVHSWWKDCMIYDGKDTYQTEKNSISLQSHIRRGWRVHCHFRSQKNVFGIVWSVHVWGSTGSQFTLRISPKMAATLVFSSSIYTIWFRWCSEDAYHVFWSSTIHKSQPDRHFLRSG